jgi:hypothetical protein
MKKPLSLIYAAVTAIVAIVIAAGWAHKRYYPHGLRSGKLPTFMATLAAYASDHDGKYPDGGATPLESLQKLYPKYACSELAGLSGDEDATRRCLEDGKALNSAISSWVYFPGFSTNDDPNIAIIWEKEEGIFVNGSRGSGHAVGLIGGYDQIPASQWPAFLKKQELLRGEARKR